MKRRMYQGLAIVMMAVGSLGFGALRASAELDYSQCPAISDSIKRLYSAYFERAPDNGGFLYWTDQWGTAARSLPHISDSFVQSPEFVRTYGGLSNEEFVDLVYQNVLGRSPDAGGRAFWIRRLNEGLTRGVMMLQFSESAEFVGKTGTKLFFGGEFQTFPTGTVFYCGSGEAVIAITPINDQRFIHSTGRLNQGENATGNFIIWLRDAQGETVNLLANELLSDPSYNGVDWPQEASVTTTIDHFFRKTSTQLTVSEASEQLQWAVVIYPPHIQASPFG